MGSVPTVPPAASYARDLVELDPPKPDESSSVYESDASESREPVSYAAAAAAGIGPSPLAQHETAEPEQQQSITDEPGRQNEQQSRTETYTIRHINRKDSSGQLGELPILIQNKNGPCPLLALVNSLVLSSKHDGQSPIVKSLQTREHVSLGLLIQALFDELTGSSGPDSELLPDIEALSHFLTMLHTGMNVNPRLTLESSDSLGTFLPTSDIRLYSTFGIPLVHGWIAEPSSETEGALSRVAQYHEDIQLLQFQKADLEQRVVQDGGTLTPQEEELVRDIQTIQTFTEVEAPTQLTPFGLKQLREKLAGGSISILFRNDHFSTLYRHPDGGLFTLVTDAGYANHAEIVWESLVDVKGAKSGLFSSDFLPVGNNDSTSAGPRSSNAMPREDQRHREETKLSPQEQADADYAYALSLQFQEEERQQQQRRRERSSSAPFEAPVPPPRRPSAARNDRSGQQHGDGQLPPSYEQVADDNRQQRRRRARSTALAGQSYGRRPGNDVSSVHHAPSKDREKGKECTVM